MKILHLGNIANIAYNNCKVLRQHGFDVEVLSVNNTHVMAQPEWEDAQFEGDVSEHNPNWEDVDLKGFTRSEWFKYLSVFETTKSGQKSDFKLKARVEHKRQQLAYLLKDIGLNKTVEGSVRFPKGFRARLKTIAALVHYSPYHLFSKLSDQYDSSRLTLSSLPSEKQLFLKQQLAKGCITTTDLKQIWPVASRLIHHLHDYDLFQGYGTDVIYAYLACGGKPFIAYEHGTLRDYPFIDSAQGRLLSRAYQQAAHVFITNPDVLDSAHRLGLERYSFVPHAVDTGRYNAGPSKLSEQIKQKYTGKKIIFAPARQNWPLKGNDILIKGFAVWREQGGQGVLLLSDWGQTKDKSLRLISEMGISESIEWLPPVAKHKLIDYYRAADVVLDQFTIGTFGGLAPEAMSCETPVIMHFEQSKHHWCYPQMPPVINAQTDQQVSNALLDLMKNTSYKAEMGKKSRDWVRQYYSNPVVAQRHKEIYLSLGVKSDGTQ